jgi:hypothetical protein
VGQISRHESGLFHPGPQPTHLVVALSTGDPTEEGIHLTCPDAESHECTDCCHLYGFHALRRGYATLNAERMPAPALQKKMRHKSFTTTLRYIGLADKMKKTAEVVYVSELLRSSHSKSASS